ncbi:MAG: hypothetical protein EAZ85_09265 [Bacteroidetes bacterium]|nr:MAG: hypothetical protein EAZ85_09265 [Bacteroidota bacterium]TAG88276.1 MAG: hypothetical protein EAZ20_08920 [Bacteroidota bacterium]
MKKIDENNKKKALENAKKENPSPKEEGDEKNKQEEGKKEENKNIPLDKKPSQNDLKTKKEESKANPTIDPALVFDVNSLGKPNTMAGGANEKGEAKEPKLEENQPLIDTNAFKQRAIYVKKRDMLNFGEKGDYDNLSHKNAHTKKHTLNPKNVVFGWHPYWAKEAYKSYNFSLLSIVTYFAYEVDPKTGGYATIHDWETTGLIKAAHAHKTKVLLSVACFGDKNISTFLGNRNAQANLINKVIELVKKQKGDGVHLDFEGLPVKYKSDFANFVIDLTGKLKTEIKGGLVTMSLPAIDFDNAYDVRQLEKHVNYFVINGYEFYGANTKLAGPVGLTKGGGNWWNHGLDKSIDEYIAFGVQPQKILLGISYYGAVWITKGLEVPSEARKFVKYMPYKNIRDEMGAASAGEDASSMTNFFAYRDNNDNYRQIWYDDSLALAKKYDFVVNKKIGGVGIWALGYDHGYPQLWEVLAAKFAPEAPAKKMNITQGLNIFSRMFQGISRFAANPSASLRSPSIFFPLLGVFFASALAFYYLIQRYACQFKRTTTLVLQGGLFVILLLLACLFFIGFQIFSFNIAMLIALSFVLGVLTFVLLTRKWLIEKELP